MVNNDNENLCGFGDDIVSYIYDEMGTRGRSSFESHLAACTSCTDEFAAVAYARFSVFEWQKEEFSHLATPEIVVPYHVRRPVAQQAVSEGSIARLIGIFTQARLPLAAAVALAIVVGLGFAALQFLGTHEQQIASNLNQKAQADVQMPVERPVEAAQASQPPDPPMHEIDNTATEIQKTTTAVPARRPANASRRVHASRRIVANPRTRTANIAQRPAESQVGRAPVLNSFDDYEDSSLRLSDLFDDDGAGG